MIIDVALLVGVFLNLLKGIDLLLTSKQREQIQDFFEDLTLRIDHLEYDDWIRNLTSPGVQAVFVGFTYVQLFVMAILGFIFQAKMELGGSLYEAFGTEGLWFQIGALAISLITLLFAWRWPLPSLMRWLIGEGSGIAKRRTLLLVGGLALFGLYQVVLVSQFCGDISDIFTVGSNAQHIFFFFGMLAVYPAFIVFWVAIQSIGGVLSARTAVGRFCMRSYIRLLRASLWRIVEYKGGAVHALVLIATIVLGITKLLV